ncbi:MAG: hypothetical protein KME27_24700 [Lyngbya sp. HA4199-MV5]|nr:hypothetical protein [Lyngbya sp. HA4199-MV5]
MSEPNLAYSSLLSEGRHSDDKSLPDDKSLLDSHGTAALEAQRQQWEQEQATLQAELRQARSVSHEQIERIRHLEQALDQSVASLREMRLQVVDQHLLEAQLASTEEISNIQQQAIGRLKLQLAQQQQALSVQLVEMQTRDRSLQALLHTMEALTQMQQQAVEQLQTQMVSDRTEVDAHQHQLEERLVHLQADLTTQPPCLEPPLPDTQALSERLTARLTEAQVHVNELSLILNDRQMVLRQLEAELQQAQLTLQEQQALLTRLQQIPVYSRSTGAIAASATPAPGDTSAITPDLATAHAKIVALEAQAAKQTTAQAMLRHACQELEEERDRQQARIAALESQTTDMQEQILRQAQQASEYETAIQHWKDRCFSSQHGVLNLKTLLDQALPDPPTELADIFAALLAAAEETVEPGSPGLPSATAFNREPKVDLPDFLLRRRNHKTRRS